ncbi:type II toxin-antitoxin system VapC family toxin [Candidatus Albibeggiatoa sp. nov. NOAA]|uniref:type II toxin-antitoxin system VapC family toxin n=1 Tax=Candidatus Albibeggiatoa sp. nov. NOAA TaxID=3162724 RepID=UPI003301E2D8|nr:type II toxin-antitoxin system VapC family toxin [Thiotrichaceae bacterium]
MIAFLDTSSLLKLYHYEKGTQELTNQLADAEAIYLSELTILEFTSAIWKKVRMREIDKDKAAKVISCFQNDSNKFQWVALDFISTGITAKICFNGIAYTGCDTICFCDDLKKSPKCVVYNGG